MSIATAVDIYLATSKPDACKTYRTSSQQQLPRPHAILARLLISRRVSFGFIFLFYREEKFPGAANINILYVQTVHARA